MARFILNLTIALLLNGTVNCFPRLNITAAVFGIMEPNRLSSLAYLLPGFQAGLDEIEKELNYSVNTTVLTWDRKVFRDCDDLTQYMHLLPEFYYKSRSRDKNSMFLLLHSGCDEIFDVATLSAEWSTILLSSVSPIVRGRRSSFAPYRNEVSLSLVDFQQMIQAVFELLKYYSWTTAAVVRNEEPVFFALADVLNIFNQNLKDKFSFTTYFLPNNMTLKDGKLLTKLRLSTRVILLLMPAQPIRSFMSSVSLFNMTNGDYVYISIFPYYNERRYGSMNWNQSQPDDLRVKDAFRSLLHITTSCHAEQTKSNPLNEKLKTDGASKYGAVYGATEEPTFAKYMYDLVMIAGSVLNEALRSSIDPKNGAALANLFRDRAFGVDNQSFRTDHYNRILLDYCVQDFNYEQGAWSSSSLRYRSREKTMVALNGTSVDWGNVLKSPPPNEPFCGYAGDRPACQPQSALMESTGHWVIVMVLVLLVVTGVGVYIRRRSSRDDRWWLITGEIRAADRFASQRFSPKK